MELLVFTYSLGGSFKRVLVAPLPELTAGDGLTGGPYDGTTAEEFDVSLSNHTAGDGFTAVSGDYNGLSPQTWDLDFLTANTLNGDTENPARSNHTHNPADANLEELTAGDGLTGGPYDGTSAEEFDVSLSNHTAGDGFTAVSGDYNGLSPQTWDLDFLTANTLNGDTENPARSNHTHNPADANLEELTAGDGLTGGPYDGTSAEEFDVSLSNFCTLQEMALQPALGIIMV